MDTNNHKHPTDPSLQPAPSSSISRRKLLSTLGAAGLALATGDVFLNAATAQAASPSSVIYNIKDYGARGNFRFDEDDAPYIQSALDAAAITGGIVFVPAGVYFVKMPLRLSSNVTLMGTGNNSILRSSMNKFGILNISAAHHIHIHRLAFQGVGTFGMTSVPLLESGVSLNLASDIRITDCLFSSIDNGVKSVDSSRVVVEGCTFDTIIGTLDYDSQGFGIWCSNAADHYLAQNYFNMLFQTCIYMSNGSRNSEITRNHMQKCYTSAIDLVSAPKEEPCKFNTISSNIIENFTNSSGKTGYTAGIRLKGNCISNIISSNVLSDIDDSGIQLLGSADRQKERPHYNQISDNQLQTIGVAALHLINAYDNQIWHNTVQGCKGDAILLASEGKGAGSFCDRNQVTSNSLNRCTKAPIRITDANCQETVLFGNLGTGNGEKIIDKGKDTVTSAL
ncbi:right-handed parallel beta-helix repeat-containing protein [Paenibacillus marchantiophytorum]|uniref:right-handed parallel beta-helix repeat-containing protein n=1 Tax=Paenibacillus marchantiophytorum TaxID=1619310 RepID=UPI00166EA149|nr:right-handed parallel beta-helix repeat-containing protein [Paenibacillus marchantiophytorum]